jgi:hypothetical protein
VHQQPDEDGAAVPPLPAGLPLLPTAEQHKQKAGGKDVEVAAASRGRWRGRGKRAVQQPRTQAGASKGRRPSKKDTAGRGQQQPRGGDRDGAKGGKAKGREEAGRRQKGGKARGREEAEEGDYGTGSSESSEHDSQLLEAAEGEEESE